MTKSKIKLFALLIIVCMVICSVLAGCNSTADYEEIYNDDVKIAKSSSCVRIASVETSAKGSYKLSCSSLSGVYIMLNSFTVSEETSANLSFELTDGKGKIVLVKGDNVYMVTEGSYDGTLNLSNIPDGKYKLKIVGVEAEFSLRLSY